jgi:membrane-associated phospholipid phosphatase
MLLLYPRGRWLWLTLATLIAATRILSGSHYPGDVAAGAYLAALVTLMIARPWRRRGLI